MQLNKEQEAIINATEQYIVVNAAAGSGKTTVLTERLKKLLDDGVDAHNIVAITFTNNAAEELQERVGIMGRGAFIGTVHSYANYLLCAYGIDTKKYLEEEDFDALFELIKKNTGCIRSVQYLFLDEAQDSTDQQFEFLLNMVMPENWMLVGDQRQSIYRFASADPDEFIKLQHSHGVKTYYLLNNYRCGTKILEYAKGIIHLAGIDYDDNSVSMTGRIGTVQDVEYSSDTLSNGIITWTKKYNQEWRDWFVLCRTNDEIEYFCSVLKDKGVPCDTFKRKDLTRANLHKKLRENTVKVLTIHAAKGLEARNVAVIGARFYNIEEKCVAYVAATRAKELLIWARQPVGKKKYQRNTYRTNVRSWE